MAREYANGPSWMNSTKGMISFNAAASAVFMTVMGVINGGKKINEIQKGDQVYDKNNKKIMKLDADEISSIGFILDRVIMMGGFAQMFSAETKVGTIKATPTGIQIYHQINNDSSIMYINESLDQKSGMPIYYMSVSFKNNGQDVLQVNLSLGGFEGLYKLKTYFDSFPVLSVLAANASNASNGGGYNKNNNGGGYNNNNGGGYNKNNNGGGYNNNNGGGYNNNNNNGGYNNNGGGGYNAQPKPNNGYNNNNNGGGYNAQPQPNNGYNNNNGGGGYNAQPQPNTQQPQANGSYNNAGNSAANMMN